MTSSNEVGETETSLLHIRKICRVINLVLRAAFVVFCAGWIFATAFMIYSLVNPEPFSSQGNVSGLTVVLHIARGGVIAMLFIILLGVFSDVYRGASPFTLIQVKRLRLMSLALAIYAVLEFVLSANTALLQYRDLNAGYISVETSSNTIMAIDFAPIIVSIVVFAFSFVFKYGVLLQEFSDETL